jgi:hypothetical protein
MCCEHDKLISSVLAAPNSGQGYYQPLALPFYPHLKAKSSRTARLWQWVKPGCQFGHELCHLPPHCLDGPFAPVKHESFGFPAYVDLPGL